MAELKINKEWIEEAVQPVIDDVKANYIHKSVIEEIIATLQKLADDEWNKQVGSSKGLEDALDVIEDIMSKHSQCNESEINVY